MSEDTNRNAAAESLDELKSLEYEMCELARSLMEGEKMEEFTMALRLNTFSDRILQALGIMPRMGEKEADFHKRQGALNEAWAAAIAALSPVAPKKEQGGALKHCGYEADEDKESGCYMMKLSTPYVGAKIDAFMSSIESPRREWVFRCMVRNNRGVGWDIRGTFHDCGRFVAKSMLRSMALELRRAYCHRGSKIRKRAIARAKAAEQAAE